MRWLLAVCLACFPAWAWGQDYIEITGARFSLVTLAQGQGTDDPYAQDLLATLRWSGLFEPVKKGAADLELQFSRFPKFAKVQLVGLEGLVFYTGTFALPAQEVQKEINGQAAEIIKTLTGEKPAFGSGILYVTKNKAQGYRLELTDFLVQRHKVFSTEGRVVLLPRWDLGGKQLAYTYLGDHGPQTRVLRLKGLVEELRPGKGQSLEAIFTDNPNRMLLTLSIQGDSDLYWFERKSRQLFKETQRGSTESSPSLDSTGQRLLFVSDRSGSVQIYQKNLTSGLEQRMTFEGNYNSEPCWSPSAKFFAFSGLVEGNYQIFLMDQRGLIQRQLTHGPGSKEQPRFSPDGRQILYVNKVAGKQKLYLMRVDGSYVRRLTSSPDNLEEFNPDWSQGEIEWPEP